MILTSYFAKYHGDNGVAICRGAKWWTGEKYLALAPPSTLIAWWKNHGHTPDTCEKECWGAFRKMYYKEVLDKLDVHTVAKELDGKILLCFEKTRDKCHRHIVAEWLRNAGYDCREL